MPPTTPFAIASVRRRTSPRSLGELAVVALALVATALDAQPAANVLRLEGLERLHFEPVDPESLEGRCAPSLAFHLGETLPPEDAPGPPPDPQQDVTCDDLGVDRHRLPVGGRFSDAAITLVEAIDWPDQRIRDLYWCVYQERRRTGCWHFTPSSERSGGKGPGELPEVDYKERWVSCRWWSAWPTARRPSSWSIVGANRPSHEGAALWLDRAAQWARDGAGFERVRLRGDTDFSLTTSFDRWSSEIIEFVVAAVKSRNDVLDVENSQRRIILMKLAILTAVAGAFSDRGSRRGIHRLR